MTVTIAVAGKGGTGKTTLSGLLVRYLVQHNGGKILAIDATPAAICISSWGCRSPRLSATSARNRARG